MLFVESPESVQEMQKICQTFDLPCVANMVEGGRTPILTKQELQDIGYGLAIFPATAFLAAAASFESLYDTFQKDGSSTQVKTPLYDFQKFSKLMGFDWVAEFDQAHASRNES